LILIRLGEHRILWWPIPYERPRKHAEGKLVKE
jgi:hypothetical protein